MQRTHRLLQWLAIPLLLIYLVLLTSKIVFKKNSVRYYKHYFAREYKHYSVRHGWKKANTVPFRTINMYYKGYQHHNANATYNLLGNLLGFVPLGILLPLALPFFRRWWAMLAAAIIVPVGFEVVQLYTGLGIFDVDDLLLNTIGVVGGYLVLMLGLWMLGLLRRGQKAATTA
jgi:glycopeptide antibiotics resistance protein